MITSRLSQRILSLVLALTLAGPAFAENDAYDSYQEQERRSSESKSQDGKTKSKSSYEYSRSKKAGGRKYMVPDKDRVDAGVFHVGFAVGGNFYIEPQFTAATGGNTGSPTGVYFKDFGFQGGLYFDYDYSALTENVPLSLRGMIGYKYILSSVHVLAFDAMVRWMSRLSEKVTFGIGGGISNAVWIRSITATSNQEEIIFLPSAIIGAGFEFPPFMVDLKMLINRLGEDSTILGFELYFGFRL